jgi:hypothetical protein
VESGPDVFADALVQPLGRMLPGLFSKIVGLIARGLDEVALGSSRMALRALIHPRPGPWIVSACRRSWLLVLGCWRLARVRPEPRHA